jgi:hypothetical protein
MINKYEKIYYDIVNRAKKRKNDDNFVYEKHHIIPRCMGGNDNNENIVKLTLREHFICHLLLVKFTEKDYKHKMICAINRMKISKKYIINSRKYEWLRDQFINSFKNNHPSTENSWRRNVSNAIIETWKNDNERRNETSERMKKLWREGKLKPKFGKDNGMFGKISPKRNKKYPGTGKLGKNNPASKIYIIKCPTGEEIQIDCLKTFCDDNKLNYGCMIQVSKGKNKQHRGFLILRKESKQ